MFSNEGQTVPGDVIEHEDGSRYVVLANGSLAYLGNRVMSRSTDLLGRSGRPCRILGRMSLLPHVLEHEVEMDDIETDWDRLRRRERIPFPLPKGCTCGHDALSAVVTCEYHEIRVRHVSEERPTLPAYHKMLDYLCTELGVTGSPTFWEAVAAVKDRLRAAREQP